MTSAHHELIGKLVRHADCPDEHFFVERFEGEYRTKDGQTYDRVWVRGIERYADQSFPARADELHPVTLN
jgi:hypothetical protein